MASTKFYKLADGGYRCGRRTLSQGDGTFDFASSGQMDVTQSFVGTCMTIEKIG